MGATIKEVAARANVSAATVSKYLNGIKLKEVNAKAVEAAIEELDFKVNETARALRKNQSMTVGVLIPELNNVFTTDIISHIEHVLMQFNYSTIICDYNGDMKLEKQKLEFLLNKRVDGLIIMPMGLTQTDIETIDIPIVFLDRKLEVVDDNDDFLNYVIVDNEKASYEATKLLVENGHSKIGIICGDKDVYTSKYRLKGYKKALSENNIAIDERFILNGEYTIKSGYSLTTKLIEEKSPITALILTSYDITVGGLMALSENSIRIYDDLSVIVFDTLELSKITTPRITVVMQPLEDIGVNTANLLLKKLKDKDSQNKKITLDTKMILNGSVKSI